MANKMIYLADDENAFVASQPRGFIRRLVKGAMASGQDFLPRPERATVRELSAEGLAAQVDPTADGLIDQLRRAGIDVACSFVFPSISPGYESYAKAAARSAKRDRRDRHGASELQGMRGTDEVQGQDLPVRPQTVSGVDPVTGEVS